MGFPNEPVITSGIRLVRFSDAGRLRICGLILLILASGLSGASPSDYYTYQIIAKTGQVVAGQTALTGMGDSPSVNAAGVVAFIGQFIGGEGVVAGDGINPLILVSPNRVASNIFFGRAVQIADSGQIIATDRAVGNPPLYWVRRWDVNNPGSSLTVATSNVAFPQFDAVFAFGTTSNNTKVAFGGLQHNSANTLLATATTSPFLCCTTIVMPNNSLLRPMIADDGRVVVKFGNALADPIRLYSFDLSTFTTIADSADFLATGNSPGISEDGQIVTFYGDVNVSGSAKYGPGKGIFASIDVGTPTRKIVRVAGVSAGGFTDFVDGRVGVNGTQATQRGVTIVYRATHTTGDGVYSSRLSFFGSSAAAFSPATPQQVSVGLPTPVLKIGDSIPGLTGTVQTFNLGDPVNSRDRGDVTLWVSTSAAEQAVLRARPQLVVFLEFDPVANFTPADEPVSVALLTSYGVNANWQGSMADVLAASGRGFNAATIQNDIVNQVQVSFDQLASLPNIGVNVKVLGKVGEVAPSEGPVLRVFIGDGPLGQVQCTGTKNDNCQLAGISPVIDLFNQYAVVEDWNDKNNNNIVDPGEFVDLNGNGIRDVADYSRKAVFVFVDNIFRVSDVDGDGVLDGYFFDPSLQPVLLSSTGPGAITQTDVELAISSTISHETGHALGMRHLINSSPLLMNAYPDTKRPPKIVVPCAAAPLADELRTVEQFGNVATALNPCEIAPATGSENSGARLALSLGSDADTSSLTRDQPSAVVLSTESRNVFRIAASGLPPTLVQRAFVVLTPNGAPDRLPEVIDVGSGSLSGILLNIDILVRQGDQITVLASTNGSTIDIFTVVGGTNSNLGTVDLGNAWALLTDSRLRSDLFDMSGNPVAIPSLDVYQIQGGIPIMIGSTGVATPTIASVVPNTGQQGQTLASVAITGQNTNFVQGTTVASFGAGITVNSLTVNSATTATANITIQEGAASGARDVTMTTGSEVATLTNGFTVTAARRRSPRSPNTGQQGQTLANVAITARIRTSCRARRWPASAPGSRSTASPSTAPPVPPPASRYRPAQHRVRAT